MSWNFRLVMLFLAVGWGPLFIAEPIREANSRLDASYVLQHYALLWMPITELCTLLAAVVSLVAVIRFALGRLRTSQREQ